MGLNSCLWDFQPYLPWGRREGRPDKLNWRGFIQRISRTWAEGGSLCSTREKNSKVTKEKWNKNGDQSNIAPFKLEEKQHNGKWYFNYHKFCHSCFVTTCTFQKGLLSSWIYFGFDGKYQAITTINHFAQAKCTFFVKAGPRCNFDLLWLLLPIFVFVFLLFLWLCLCLFLCLCLWKQAPHSNFNLLSLPSPIFVFAGNFPTTRKLILPS